MSLQAFPAFATHWGLRNMAMPTEDNDGDMARDQSVAVARNQSAEARQRLIAFALAVLPLLCTLLQKIQKLLDEDFVKVVDALSSTQHSACGCKRRRVANTPRRQTVHRVQWDDILHRVSQRVLFMRYYRLSQDTFYHVLHRIRPMLVREGRHPSMLQLAISPEIMLAATLRWLAGGSYLDIMIIHGISKGSFYDSVHLVLEAIIHHFPLAFPCSDVVDIAKISQGVKKLAGGNHVFQHSIGFLDGILISIQCPSLQDTPKPTAFYTRKSKFALNAQGVCDSEMKFVYASIKTPGSTHDSTAWNNCNMSNWLQDTGIIPPPYYMMADAAYKSCERILTPFDLQYANTSTDNHRLFNLSFSSLRSKIECAWGLLINRFGIFWRPIRCKIVVAVQIVAVCMALHNLCLEYNRADNILGTYDGPESEMEDSSGRIRNDMVPPEHERIMSWNTCCDAMFCIYSPTSRHRQHG
eukprot:765364-Hanusia_phi.AAC.1